MLEEVRYGGLLVPSGARPKLETLLVPPVTGGEAAVVALLNPPQILRIRVRSLVLAALLAVGHFNRRAFVLVSCPGVLGTQNGWVVVVHWFG